MDSKAFAKQFLLDEVEQMKAAHVRLHLLSAMVHGIETAGALLDPLPFKAKGQGKKRFGLALRRLFPAAYERAARDIDLYGQLRSHMAHCMLPANTIILSDHHHLQMSENMMHINLDLLFNDYCCAMKQLIEQLESGNLKNKKIVFDNLRSIAS